MAKKKKRKDEKTTKFAYSAELNGLLLVLISIIGIGRFGVVGNLILSFAMFLVGTWARVLLITTFGIGAYTVLKTKWPNFFSSRLIGLYILSISILIFSHVEYVKQNNIKVVNIFSETFSNIMSASGNSELIQGGGMLGAIFSTLFVKLFDVKGTAIVGVFLLLFGIIIFTNISPIEKLKWVIKKIKSLFMKLKSPKKLLNKGLKEIEEAYDKNNKIVISNIDELTQISDTKEEHVDDNVSIELNKESEDSARDYKLPPMSLLNVPKRDRNKVDQELIEKNIEILEKVLDDFRLSGKVVEVNIGPSVTQYEMALQPGTKVSRLLSIHREISLALAAKDVRIQAPIPGKNTVGVEIPNPETTMVTMREMLDNVPPSMKKSKLLVVLGKNIMGRPIFAEINNTPHLLVAGATGSGKSVCINCIIASILMRTMPDEVKLLLVDPKKVELSSYNGVPHLIAPVVTDPKKASIALKKIVSEMEQRYELFNGASVKNIAGYNAYIENKNKRLTEAERIKKMPYIVVIIDELADLMMVAAKEVEESITRITQLARAAGIHLIAATQRPSTDVITGLIKSNIPSRISFAVSSSIDSRTILDMSGAEKLLGKGDMLFVPMGESVPLRVQGAFISEDEIKRIIDFVINQQKAEYDDKLIKLEDTMETNLFVDSDEEEYEDPLYNEIVEFVIRNQKASASLLQRKYRLGYNRAARIIDLLEERGIIGPPNGSKPREVLVALDEDE
ncbi:MAG: DNA translocase FtsK [Bacilli bacterium]|nr:DNA translocase FtsK [Bacilli bacterium]